MKYSKVLRKIITLYIKLLILWLPEVDEYTKETGGKDQK